MKDYQKNEKNIRQTIHEMFLLITLLFFYYKCNALQRIKNKRYSREPNRDKEDKSPKPKYMKISELKEYIKDLPDDKLVEIKKVAWSNILCIISIWDLGIVTKLI